MSGGPPGVAPLVHPRGRELLRASIGLVKGGMNDVVVLLHHVNHLSISNSMLDLKFGQPAFFPRRREESDHVVPIGKL